MKERPKLRKVNTAKRKKDHKEAQERLSTQTSLMMNHPKECCVCENKFHRTKESVLSWHVTVIEERVRLTCPECWESFRATLESIPREDR